MSKIGGHAAIFWFYNCMATQKNFPASVDV